MLAGLPAFTLAPFQRVLHAVPCTVLDLKPCDRVTPVLRELYWLPVAERIQYKLCLLVHKSFLGHTPEYISDRLTTVANIPGQSTLRVSSCCNLLVPWTRQWIGDRAFSIAAPWAWTSYRQNWNCCNRRTHSIMIWKHFCFILSMGTRIQI